MLIFDGCLVRKNGYMTITILSIAHIGIPNWAIPMQLYGDSQYIELSLLIGPFPWDLSVHIYNLNILQNICFDLHFNKIEISYFEDPFNLHFNAILFLIPGALTDIAHLSPTHHLLIAYLLLRPCSVGIISWIIPRL
jgi:hypothetical protein